MEPWVPSLQSASGADPVAIVFESLALLTHSTNVTGADSINSPTNPDAAVLKAHLIAQHADGVVMSTCRSVLNEAWWGGRAAVAAMLHSTEVDSIFFFGNTQNDGVSQVFADADPTFVTPFKVASAAVAFLRDGGVAPTPITATNALTETINSNVTQTAVLFTNDVTSANNCNSNNSNASTNPAVATVDSVVSAAAAAALAQSAAASSYGAAPTATAIGNFHKLLTRLLDCLHNTQSMAVKTVILQTITTYLQTCSMLLEETVLAQVVEEICEDVGDCVAKNRKRAIQKIQRDHQQQQGLGGGLVEGSSSNTLTVADIYEGSTACAYHHRAAAAPGLMADDDIDEDEEALAVARVWQELTVEVSRLLLPPQWLVDVLRLLPESALTVAYAAYAQHQQSKLDDASSSSNAGASATTSAAIPIGGGNHSNATTTTLAANPSSVTSRGGGLGGGGYADPNSTSNMTAALASSAAEDGLLPLPIITALRNSTTFSTLANSDNSLAVSYTNATSLAEAALECMETLLVDPSSSPDAFYGIAAGEALFGTTNNGGAPTDSSSFASPALAASQSSRLYNSNTQQQRGMMMGGGGGFGSPAVGPASAPTAVPNAAAPASLCPQLHPCLRHVLSSVTTLTPQQRVANATTVMLWDHVVRCHLGAATVTVSAAHKYDSHPHAYHHLVAPATINDLLPFDGLLDEPPALLPCVVPSSSFCPLATTMQGANSGGAMLSPSSVGAATALVRKSSNVEQLVSAGSASSPIPRTASFVNNQPAASASSAPLRSCYSPTAVALDTISAAVAQLDPILSTWGSAASAGGSLRNSNTHVRTVVAEGLLARAVHEAFGIVDNKNRSLALRLERALDDLRCLRGGGDRNGVDDDDTSDNAKPPIQALLTEVVEFLAAHENTDMLLLQALVGSPKLFNALVATANHRISNMAQTLSAAGDKRASAFIGWESPTMLWQRWSLLPNVCQGLHDRHETLRLLATNLSEVLKKIGVERSQKKKDKERKDAGEGEDETAESERLAFESMKKVLQQHREFDNNVVTPLPLGLIKFLDKHWHAMPTVRQLKEVLAATWIVADGSALLDAALGTAALNETETDAEDGNDDEKAASSFSGSLSLSPKRRAGSPASCPSSPQSPTRGGGGGAGRTNASPTSGFADLLYQFDSATAGGNGSSPASRRGGGSAADAARSAANATVGANSATALAIFSGGRHGAGARLSRSTAAAIAAAKATAKSRQMLQVISAIASYITVQCTPSSAVRIINAAETILQSAHAAAASSATSTSSTFDAFYSPPTSGVGASLLAFSDANNHQINAMGGAANSNSASTAAVSHQRLLNTLYQVSAHLASTSPPNHLVAFFPLILKTFQSLSVSAELAATTSEDSMAHLAKAYAAKVVAAKKKAASRRRRQQKQQQSNNGKFALESNDDAIEADELQQLLTEAARLNALRTQDAVRQCVIYNESTRALRQLLHHLSFRVSELPNEWLSGNALLQCVACYLASTAVPDVLTQREEELVNNGGGGGNNNDDDATGGQQRRPKKQQTATPPPADSGLNDDGAAAANDNDADDVDDNTTLATLSSDPFIFAGAPKIPAALVAKCNAEAALTVPTAEAFLKTMAKHFSSPAVGEHTAVILTLLHHLPTKKVSSMLQIDAAADTADTLNFCERRSMHTAVLPTVQPYAIAAVLCEAIQKKVLADGSVPDEDAHTLAATSVSSYSEHTDLCLKICFEVANPANEAATVPDLLAGTIQLYSTTPGVVIAANVNNSNTNNAAASLNNGGDPSSPSITAAGLVSQHPGNASSPPSASIFLSIPLCGNKIRQTITTTATTTTTADGQQQPITIPTVQLSASVTTVVRVSDSRPITIAGNFIGADGREVPLCVRTRKEQTVATLAALGHVVGSQSPADAATSPSGAGGAFTLGSPLITPATAPHHRRAALASSTRLLQQQLQAPCPTLTLEPSRYVFAVAKGQPLPSAGTLHVQDLQHCTMRDVGHAYASRLEGALGARATFHAQRNLSTAYRGGGPSSVGGGPSSFGRSSGSLHPSSPAATAGAGSAAAAHRPITPQTYFLYICPGDVVAVQITPTAGGSNKAPSQSQRSAALESLAGYLSEEDSDDDDDDEEEAAAVATADPTAATVQVLCSKSYLLTIADRILNEFVAETM